MHRNSSLLYTVSICHDRSKGRPREDVRVDEILALRSLNYNWTKIASLLNVSRSTLYRRLQENNIPTNDFDSLSDATLDEIVQSIKCDHPNDGEVMMQGHLRRVGVKVKRQDLRDSIHRVDHEHTQQRRSCTIQRRVYSTEHPNFVWHIDGHHKLIRWRFVTHASIDGFSRTITYIRCANNNRAQTVLELFTEAVSHFGLPDRVRSDHGGKNIDVWRYMLAAHNNDQSSVITGSSTHNERVERLWRDVHRCVAKIFSDLFTELEIAETLDPLNDVDLYCLHYIFLPRINQSLIEFKDSWNNHALSTAGNLTPSQLFFEGATYLPVNIPDATQLSAVTADVSAMSRDRVAVPRIAFQPCSGLMAQLATLNPHLRCQDNGRRMYTQCIHLVGEHLRLGCNDCLSL